MPIDESEESRKMFRSAMEGLGHKIPQVRVQYARFLSRWGGKEALEALKQAYLAESNILCKTEMVRAIVALEERLGLTEGSPVAAETARS